jgi:DnaK suppressor protein
MTTITATSIAHSRMRARLNARRDELDALLQSAISTASHGCDEPAEVRDFKEVGAEESRLALDDVVLARAVRAREQVIAALCRIDEGTYGHCLACGEAIDARRLEAVPAAALCSACQMLDERSRAVGR